jgi:hypothetical protein
MFNQRRDVTVAKNLEGVQVWPAIWGKKLDATSLAVACG